MLIHELTAVVITLDYDPEDTELGYSLELETIGRLVRLILNQAAQNQADEVFLCRLQDRLEIVEMRTGEPYQEDAPPARLWHVVVTHLYRRSHETRLNGQPVIYRLDIDPLPRCPGSIATQWTVHFDRDHIAFSRIPAVARC